MSYNFKLENISLNDFKNILRKSYLIPSMRVLLEELDENMDLLDKLKIDNMNELYLQTKTKGKAIQLAEESGIAEDYMIVLRRMVSSYIAKPRKLEEYPDVDNDLLITLGEMKIKTSVDLYKYLEEKELEEAKNLLGIDEETYEIVYKLMKVTRLRYVSPLFATVLVRSGYDSIQKIAEGNSKELHKAIISTNKEQHIYKGNVGDSDAQFLIDDAKVFLKYSKEN